MVAKGQHGGDEHYSLRLQGIGSSMQQRPWVVASIKHIEERDGAKSGVADLLMEKEILKSQQYLVDIPCKSRDVEYFSELVLQIL
jgi:hypothetical protein